MNNNSYDYIIVKGLLDEVPLCKLCKYMGVYPNEMPCDECIGIVENSVKSYFQYDYIIVSGNIDG